MLFHILSIMIKYDYALQFRKGGCIIFNMWLSDGMSRLGFDNVFVQLNVMLV